MADNKLDLEVASKAKVQSSEKRAPRIKGYRAAKDVKIATRSGTISVKAHLPVLDQNIIGYLQRAGVKLDPIYEEE